MRLLQESNTKSLYESLIESLDYDVNEPNNMDTVRYHRDNKVGGSILINTYSDNFPNDPLTKEDVGKRVYDLRAYDNNTGFEAYDVVEDNNYDGGFGYKANPDADIWVDDFDFDMTDDEVDSYAKEKLGFNKPKNESVMINTGSTTITSDETGVTVEDNGNVITSGNGVTVDVDNEADVLPAEMDIAAPVDEVPADIVADVPAEDIENVEPVEELPSEEVEEEEDEEEDEDDLEESTVNEEVLEKKDEETEEEVNNSKIEEADGYNQSQNVEVYQNPEFDYQILDITELDNVDSGDIRAIDMANILNDLDESLTEAYGDENYFRLNSFLTRKGTHKKTNESYSSAILELSLPKLNESIGEYKNTFFLEVYGDKALKECVVRDSSNHIIKEYSGKSSNPVEHFKNVMIDIDRARRLTEEIRQEAYLVGEAIANQFNGQELINWEDFRDAFEMYTNEINPSLLSDENLHDFELEVRDVLNWNYGYATIYEGEYEGGLTTNSDMFEAVEVMVNEPMKDKGVNFADSKAITKDEERQKNHLKQHANRNKENKKFKIEKEPDQNNTTGVKEEDITDTEKVDKLPKAKKTKVDAEKLKVKEIKESEKLDEDIDINKLKAARGRENKSKQDADESKRADFTKNVEYVYSKLNSIYDSYLEIGKYLYDEGIVSTEIPVSSYDSKDSLIYANGVQHNFGIVSYGEAAFRAYGVEGGGYCGNVGIIFTKDGIDLTDEDMKTTRYNDISEVSGKDLDYYLSMSEDAANPEYNNVDKFIERIEDIVNTYTEKFPELEQISESAKLKETDELLDEPEITDGSDMRDGREDLEESGTEVAIFHRKPQSVSAMRAAEQNGITVNKSNYKIVGKKELSGDEFNKFANNLSSESYEWLKEYNDTSTSGEFKCVEVINTDDDSFTLLVDPQGYNYARYAAIKDNLENEEELIEPEEELINEE